MNKKDDFKQFYIRQPKDFYISQMESKGLRHWWFKKRQLTARILIKKYWSGGTVVDIGCGNCVWNNEEIPVIGADICYSMLKHNTSVLSSFYPLRADFSYGLPFKSNSVKIILITEVLEHFLNYRILIQEIKRVLSNNGIVIGSVPYGRFPGLWNMFFPLWCLYKGICYHDKYYLNMCGHRVDFSLAKLRKDLAEFSLLETRIIGLLTIFFVAQKRHL